MSEEMRRGETLVSKEVAYQTGSHNLTDKNGKMKVCGRTRYEWDMVLAFFAYTSVQKGDSG